MRRFTEQDDVSTIKAQLGNLLHHYDEVRSTIRVMPFEDGSFSLSMVPPPTEEEQELIVERLEEHGYAVRHEGVVLEVVGEVEE